MQKLSTSEWKSKRWLSRRNRHTKHLCPKHLIRSERKRTTTKNISLQQNRKNPLKNHSFDGFWRKFQQKLRFDWKLGLKLTADWLLLRNLCVDVVVVVGTLTPWWTSSTSSSPTSSSSWRTWSAGQTWSLPGDPCHRSTPSFSGNPRRSFRIGSFGNVWSSGLGLGRRRCSCPSSLRSPRCCGAGRLSLRIGGPRTSQEQWTTCVRHINLPNIEAPSDVKMPLDGSTYPGCKMCHFSQVNIFLENQNASGYIREQCCHLKSDGASLSNLRWLSISQHIKTTWVWIPQRDGLSLSFLFSY